MRASSDPLGAQQLLDDPDSPRPGSRTALAGTIHADVVRDVAGIGELLASVGLAALITRQPFVNPPRPGDGGVLEAFGSNEWARDEAAWRQADRIWLRQLRGRFRDAVVAREQAMATLAQERLSLLLPTGCGGTTRSPTRV